jgi:hypothetical protein
VIAVFVAYVIVAIVAAAANLYGASADLRRADWIIANMDRLGVSLDRLPLLGGLKVAGAVGLLVGIGVPLVGVAAGIGLVLFFVGAIVTVIGVRWYAHLPYPATFLLLAVAALALRVASL